MQVKFNSRQEIVDILRKRDGFACYLCPEPYTDELGPTIDHVKPLSKGGTWDLDNLKLAHRKCNQEKGDREFVDGVLEPKNRRIGYRERKQSKQQVLDAFCELCYSGRLLLPEEVCPECDREAVANPWSMKREPNACDHDRFWCWACAIGVYERKPAILDIIVGDG